MENRTAQYGSTTNIGHAKDTAYGKQHGDCGYGDHERRTLATA
jgi:hypothetical protein